MVVDFIISVCVETKPLQTMLNNLYKIHVSDM